MKPDELRVAYTSLAHLENKKLLPAGAIRILRTCVAVAAGANNVADPTVHVTTDGFDLMKREIP